VAANPQVRPRIQSTATGDLWSVPGAAGILTLRCQHASGRWEEIWQRPNNQTQPPGLASKAS